VIRLDPAGAEGRRSRAAADRHVRVQDAGDGMAWLTALLPAAQAMACYAKRACQVFCVSDHRVVC
jgi:hypothetical protein